jgi:hypothetical protein
MISKKKIVGLGILFLIVIIIGAFNYFLPNAMTKRASLSILKQRWKHRQIEFQRNFPVLQIDLPFGAIRALEKDRVKAIEHGVLAKRFKNYVSAKVKFEEKEYRSKIRLKGNLSDHWEDKIMWSLRVKLKDNLSSLPKTFGLMSPQRRGFILEWLYHRLMKYSGNHYLDYRFVELSLNEMNLGVYALEECITGDLPLNKYDNDGFVLKWDLSFFFDTLDIRSYYAKNEKLKKTHPEKVGHISDEDYFNTGFKPYGDSSNQTKERVIDLLIDFVNYKKSTSDIFDVDQLATAFAINTLFGNQHPMSISNLRFYYNPDSKLLEVIPYDLERIHTLTKQETNESQLPWVDSEFKRQHIKTMFSDTLFRKTYIKRQLEVSNVEFINAFFNEIDVDFKELNSNMNASGILLKHDVKDLILENAEFIRNNIYW